MVNRNEKTNYPKPMSFTVMVFLTGLFGGIFWGSIGFLAYYFNFTEIRANVILGPWALGNWKHGWLGTIVSIILLGFLSVGVAFFYYLVLKKIKGIWIGLAYGFVLFLLVFFVLNPLFPGLKPIFDMSRDTIITTISLYMIYGLFIGYSINYEYENNIMQENEAAT